MKREILFRGKLKKSNKFIYGLPTYDFRYIFNSSQVDSCDNYEVIPETVCQFTGLTDKNDTNIFEGDKLKCDDEFDDSYYLVEWNEELCRFQINVYSHSMHFNEGGGEEFSNDLELCDENYFDMDCLTEFEVIGNIFDSPELLK